MTTLRILNSKGDTAIAWSPAKLAEHDEETLAAVAEAERIFAEARAQGATAFRVTPTETVRMDEFDAIAEAEIVIVPRIAGG